MYRYHTCISKPLEAVVEELLRCACVLILLSFFFFFSTFFLSYTVVFYMYKFMHADISEYYNKSVVFSPNACVATEP